ncbi:MAG: cytochrome c oxidase subunit 3, partial [Actinomycetota bacterium]
SYVYLRFKNDPWPPAGVPRPELLVPLVLLGLLLATSAPIWLASRSATPKRWLLAALALQAAYFALEVRQFDGDLSTFTPQQSSYGSLYYTLLGADHAHVAIGLLLDVWILGKLLGGLTPYRRRALRAIAVYWYAVDVLTFVVTLTVLSPSFVR